jgi:hypothetical protein
MAPAMRKTRAKRLTIQSHRFHPAEVKIRGGRKRETPGCF